MTDRDSPRGTPSNPDLLVGILLRLSFACPACRQPVLVNALGPRAHCTHCLADHPLEPDWWRAVLDADFFTENLGRAETNGSIVSHMRARFQPRAENARLHPRCSSCKARFSRAAIEASAASGTLVCAQCQASVPVRAADEELRKLHPCLRWILGEDAVAELDGPLPAGHEPVMFACLACGAALRVDGRARTVTCSHCGGPSFLPDALWLRLHPARTVRDLFLVLLIDHATWLRARYAQTRPARADAFGALEDPEALPLLVAHADDDVRAALAANPRCPAAELDRLAQDPEAHVRRAVARNPSSSPETCARLTADRDSDVREIVAAHPRLPAAAMPALVGDSDSDVPRALVKRPDLPTPVVTQLARVSSYRVRQELAANPRVPSVALAEMARTEHDNDVLDALGAREELAAPVLEALAGNTERRARRIVARWATASPQLLETLVEDDDEEVRFELAGNPALGGPAVLRLTRDASTKVSERAGLHPQLPAVKAQARRRVLLLAAAAGVLGLFVACVGGAAALAGWLLTRTRRGRGR